MSSFDVFTAPSEKGEINVVVECDFTIPHHSADKMVKGAKTALDGLTAPVDCLVKVTLSGCASPLLVMVIAEKVLPLAKAVAVFDAGIGKYVVCASRDLKFTVGAVL